MKPEMFVRVLKTECRDAAVVDCLENFRAPPGRRPGADLVRISQWFENLNTEERELLKMAMREVADATLFGVLCVIDGVRAVEDMGEKSEFTLAAIRGGESSQIAPNRIFLHDLLRAEP